MRFAIVGEHRKVFEQNHYIEFEGLVTNSVRDRLKESINQVITSKAKINTLDELTFTQMIDEGKDLAFQNEECRKIIHQKNFAELIYQLADIKPLRYAYDQLLIRNRKQAGRQLKKISLKEISHLQGTLFGILLCVKKSEPKESEPTQAPFPFHLKEGDAVIFKDELQLNLDLFSETTEAYLLIVYSDAKARVIYREQNFLFHSFKKYGYLSGDLLRDDLHPILIR